MAVSIGLYLEDPKAKESRVYVRLYTRGKGVRKDRNERVGTVPNLRVKTRHWQKGGGLSPSAPQQQRKHVAALLEAINKFQADGCGKQRHVSAETVAAYLWPGPSNMWPKLFSVVEKLESASTRSVYKVALRAFQTYCEKKQPTVELYAEWVRSYGKSHACRTNTYAAGVRCAFLGIGIVAHSKGLRVAEVDKGEDLYALAPHELRAIAELPIKEGTRRALVRDAFLCGCLSSLRRSDWESFAIPNLGKAVKNGKTGKRTLLPDTHDIRTLVERHGGAMNLRNAKGKPFDVNKPLRSVAKETAKHCPSLNTMVMYKGKIVPKWHTVTSHMARRSFATIAYTRGASTKHMRKLTGHATDEQLMKYVRPIIEAQEQLAAANATSSLVFSLDAPQPVLSVVNE